MKIGGPRAEFIHIFVNEILFAKLPGLMSCSAEIVSFLRLMLTHFREKVVATVTDKLKVYAGLNYPMVLTFCEEANITKPIMAIFVGLFGKLATNPHIDLNDIIARTLQRAALRSTDRDFLESLLDREDLSALNRSRIRTLLDSNL
jgi:hypothetical protein